MTALKRLMTEYKQLTASEDEDSMFTAGPTTELDFFTWSCLISGPSDTPFEGGVFEAQLTFPRDYPLSPPKVSSAIPITVTPSALQQRAMLTMPSAITDEVQSPPLSSQQ